MQVYMSMCLGPCRDNHDVCVSGVQHKGFDCTIIGWVWLKCPLSGVFYNYNCTIGDGITVCYMELWGVRYSGVSDVLRSMEKQSGLSELSVISWVSAVEGSPLSGVPL